MTESKHSGPDQKVQALLAIEKLVSDGLCVRDAVATAAIDSGIGQRTLFYCLKKTDFKPREHWPALLARKSGTPRPRVDCHPEALRFFVKQCRAGLGVTDSYRKLAAKAKACDWEPIPSERTLRRELDRQVSKAERRAVRRNAQPTNGVVA